MLDWILQELLPREDETSKLFFKSLKQLLKKIWREPKKAGRARRPQCKSDPEWRRGKVGWVQTSLTTGQSKGCLVRLVRLSSSQSQMSDVSPGCPSLISALVSLTSINWLFKPLDINKWYRNTHTWCLLKYISYSRPQKVSDLSALFLPWPD